MIYIQLRWGLVPSEAEPISFGGIGPPKIEGASKSPPTAIVLICQVPIGRAVKHLNLPLKLN